MKQSLWDITDETAAELEMGDFLYGFVRMLKPKLVVETGTYQGQSTAHLDRAVRANGFGTVVTCDPALRPDGFDYAPFAVKYGDSIFGATIFKSCSSLDLRELAEADFIFSDSDYKFREKEIERAKPGAVIVVHDTAISYDSSIPPLAGLVKKLGGLTFQTYRGFGILIKDPSAS